MKNRSRSYRVCAPLWMIITRQKTNERKSITPNLWGLCALLCLLLVEIPNIHAQPSFGQVWIKSEKNPLGSFIGEPDSWNDAFTFSPMLGGHVLWDSTEYKLYTGGFDGFRMSIGLAVSSRLDSGWTFLSDTINPVLISDMSSWDGTNVGNPMVLKDSGIYKMWYTGAFSVYSAKIGYATSVDGISWTKYSDDPVLVPDQSWEGSAVGWPFVMKEGDTYKMWYSSWGEGITGRGIGYATSADGINWTKSDNNPVLELGSSGSWDSYLVIGGSLLFENGKYLFWYSGRQNAGGPVQLGFAESDDGINWTRDVTNNPVLRIGRPGQWDLSSVVILDVLQADGKHYMLYWGTIWNVSAGFGLAALDTEMTSGEYPVANVPTAFRLRQNYPNPFNPETRIGYEVAEPGRVVLRVMNLLGQEVSTLVNAEKPVGWHEVKWDGKDNYSQRITSGVYLYRLESRDFIKTRKMVLLQ